MKPLEEIVDLAGNYRFLFAILKAACVVPGHVAAQQRRVGQTPAPLTIEGIVASVRVSKAGVTFLNFGGPYPHRTFAAIIFRSAASLFPSPQQWPRQVGAGDGGAATICKTARDGAQGSVAAHTRFPRTSSPCGCDSGRRSQYRTSRLRPGRGPLQREDVLIGAACVAEPPVVSRSDPPHDGQA